VQYGKEIVDSLWILIMGRNGAAYPNIDAEKSHHDQQVGYLIRLVLKYPPKQPELVFSLWNLNSQPSKTPENQQLWNHYFTFLWEINSTASHKTIW